MALVPILGAAAEDLVLRSFQICHLLQQGIVNFSHTFIAEAVGNPDTGGTVCFFCEGNEFQILQGAQLSGSRIGEEADCQYNACQNSCCQNPKGGFFVVQHGFDSVLDPYFTEGQGAGDDHPSAHAAVEQCLGIVCPFRYT